MTGLSHGVIRVNTEDKNSALTVQDVGHVMPGGEAGEEVDVLFKPKDSARTQPRGGSELNPGPRF